MKCPNKVKCILFDNNDLIPMLKRNIETFYCKRSFEKCARFNFIKDGKVVPKDLLPNNKTVLYANLDRNKVNGLLV